MDKIENIFFDFFGVISCEVTKLWVDTYCKSANVEDEIRNNSVKVDMGQIGEDELFTYFANISASTKDIVIEQFISLAKINHDLVEYIKDLKNHCKIYLLSNACGPFLRRILKRNNLEALFDKIYISSEIGKIKPNADFYNYVLSDLSITPSNAIMVDDRYVNIEGANNLGIKGILFKNLSQLIVELNDIV